MIEEQQLIAFDSSQNEQSDSNTKIKSSVQAVNLNSKNDNAYNSNGISGKLGSDGKSEGSLESSLSPVDVDSLEGSEGRQSPDGEASEHQEHLEANVLISLGTENNNELVKNDLLNVCSSTFNELTTVLEEQESDSLEEFIKHESECMQEESLPIVKESKIQGHKDKEIVIYEEIGDLNDKSETNNIITVLDPLCVPESVSQLIVVDEMGSVLSSVVSQNGDVNTAEENNNNRQVDDKFGDINQPKPQIIGETYHLNQNEQKMTPTIKVIKKLKDSRPANPAESKIASEIKEFKEREEELKKMREQIKVLSVQKSTDTCNGKVLNSDKSNGNNSLQKQISSDDSKVGSSELIVQALTNLSSDQKQNNLIRSTSSKIMEPQNCGKEKFLESAMDKNQQYKVTVESPIEREIRILKEREEELRLEKLRIYQNQSQNGVSSSAAVNSPTQNMNKSPVLKQNTVTINGADTQKLLATSRIQQEIEEQTQREMALREIGSIQTLSQERTDGQVNKFCEMEKCVLERPFSSLGTSPSPSPRESPIETQKGYKFSSASSNSSTNNFPASSRKSVATISPSKGISMHQFINSKGKSLKTREKLFCPFNLPNPNLGNVDHLSCDYREMKPPTFAKSNLGALKRHVSADCKIKEELKEMKVREDELRKQRIRAMGLSQPNLSTIVSCVEDQEAFENSKQSLIKLSSNPNLNESNPNEDDEKICRVGGPRRRIALIDQWEQKIQQVGPFLSQGI